MSSNKKETGQDLSDWGQWANHVLAELKRLNDSIEELRKDLTSVTIEVVQLKVKSSLWGAMAGAVTVIAILGIEFLKESVIGKGSTQQPYYPPITYSQPANVNPTTNPPVNSTANPLKQIPTSSSKTP